MTSPKDNKSNIDELFADLIRAQETSLKNHPSTELWNPKKTGDMDLKIDREGRWIHEGGEIKRQEIVKLFSAILKFEQGHYFLVTPVEKWQIHVEIAPFFIIDATRDIRATEQAISLTTSTDDVIVISKDNPLIMDEEITQGETLPLVRVRKNLMGLISRTIFYQLIEWSDVVSLTNGEKCLLLNSMGQAFSLGKFKE